MVALPSPTNCTLQIAKAALWLLKKVFKEGVYYQKAGVMLMELVPEGGQQISLFDDAVGDSKTSNLMTTIDSINKKYAKGTIKLASEGTKKAWAMRRSFKSPNYTGDWKELPTIG